MTFRRNARLPQLGASALLLLCVGGICIATAQDPLSFFLPPQVNTSAWYADFAYFYNVNVSECASACLSAAECVSFSYSATVLRCVLSNYTMLYQLQPYADYDYYQRLQPRNDTLIQPAVQYLLTVPTSNVVLGSGVLLDAFNSNLLYLLQHSVADMLYWYNKRAGLPNPPNASSFGWDNWVTGSYVGEFLMGAGGTLRFQENATLRAMVDASIAGIKAAQADNGFIMAFPEDQIWYNNLPDYTTSWVTHGLLEASIAGNPDALGLSRDNLDWFNNNSYIPLFLPPLSGVGELPGDKPVGYDGNLTDGSPGFGEASGHLIYMITQGMIHNTRMAQTKLGRQADVDILQKLFKEDWWLRQFIEGNLSAVWQREYFPHNYEITSYEAYLDLYVITGNATFLEAMLGAWKMIHDNWEHVGGSIAINEGAWYPPQSYHIDYEGLTEPAFWRGQCVAPDLDACKAEQLKQLEHGHHDHDHDDHVGWGGSTHPTGETCGSVFWVKFNQRFHRLFPTDEVYVAEIEKEIYNVGLANIAPGGAGVRYFTNLNKQKQTPTFKSTCCEGQGTRLAGSLPEYLYSYSAGGLFVDMYAPSTMSFVLNGVPVAVETITQFPYGSAVEIQVTPAADVAVEFNFRIPSWVAAYPVPVSQNGVPLPSPGFAGSYYEVPSQVLPGKKTTTFTFDLAMGFRVTKYIGVDQLPPHSRYAYEYGPILLAATGGWSTALDTVQIQGVDALNPQNWLVPAGDGNALHFKVVNQTGLLFVPYFEIQDTPLFAVYPVIDP
eukprot:TRINITY_DN19003_c0_g1_i1.p1 TRINITY_DN19003_c0_g1~~TRINITY_DN19003_c0_g1_i1.p1  ORF type:complete len:776 (-),score=231.31 TRINITY_DN19003_c0_g1_i1:217-2544(-)